MDGPFLLVLRPFACCETVDLCWPDRDGLCEKVVLISGIGPGQIVALF